MKTIPFLRAALIALALPLTTKAQIVPPNDRVRVEVRTASESDRKDIKGTSAATVTQYKTLTILLSGKPKAPETRVIKWTAYGRDAKDRDVSVIESGEIKLDLAANGQQTAESKRVVATHTPEHSAGSKSGSGGGGGGSKGSKKVEASGVKFAGYSVQVLDGTTVVGEAADPIGIGKPKAK